MNELKILPTYKDFFKSLIKKRMKDIFEVDV